MWSIQLLLSAFLFRSFSLEFSIVENQMNRASYVVEPQTVCRSAPRTKNDVL